MALCHLSTRHGKARHCTGEHILANTLQGRDQALKEMWDVQMVMDLVSLSLYDTVIMCDDSGSMRLFEE